MFCGIVVKLILNLVLIRNPSVGIYGAPIGTVACYFTMAVVNFFFVIKYVGIQINFVKNFIKPFLATILASMVTIATYWLVGLRFGDTIATCAAILMTIITYFILLFLLRTFQRSDIIILPKGEKLYQFLSRHKWIQS